MAYECYKRRTLLYAELFKPHENMGFEEENLLNNSTSSSSADSVSSCANTAFGFDLDCEFTTELARQMAECMLEDDAGDSKTAANCIFEANGHFKNRTKQGKMDSSCRNSFKNRLNSSPFYDGDQMPRKQACDLKINQASISKQGPVYGGRREKRIQQKKGDQHDRRQRGRGVDSGSDMKVVFLGGSGSGRGSTGTGVFLPRVRNDPTQVKKKAGRSTVLIPTRVLHAFELHFNRISNSTIPFNGYDDGSTDSGGVFINQSQFKDKCMRNNGVSSQQNGDSKVEIQLPQEWTY